ncbi:MAG: hypothetical protein ACYDBH_21865 [Acidobacteriaceae bacterium]
MAVDKKATAVPSAESEKMKQMSLLQKSEHSVIYEAGMADFRIGLSLPIPK